MAGEVLRSELANLTEGTAREHIHSLLGSPGKHQFSARLEDGDYECECYSFEHTFVRYYFVYKNAKLRSIVTPPPFEIETKPHLGVVREIRKPVDPEKRLREVLLASNLLGEQFVISLESQMSGLSKRKPSFNVVPAFIFTGQEFLQAEQRIAADYRRNADLANKYSSEKIKLGDPEIALQSLYGKPLSVTEQAEGTKRIYRYGTNEPLRINPSDRFSGITIVTQNGLIVRIFCQDFYE